MTDEPDADPVGVGGRPADLVATHADRVVECERTPFGYRFEADGFETRAYWCGGYWQTTIPYWVDLLGVVTEPAFDPISDPTFAAVEG